MDGCTLDTEGEKERVIKCLEAAIRRRVSEVSKDVSNTILSQLFLLINRALGVLFFCFVFRNILKTCF